jgi:phosphohistidine phosphatase SixA
MFVYIARHAWAGHHGDPGWPDDSLRELAPEGAERYAEVVRALAKRDFAPARIATSPYARCRQTAAIIAQHVASRPSIDELAALEPGSSLEDLIAWTNEQDGCDVCWVGHNPDLQWLAAALVSDGGANIRLAKGSVAAVRFEGGAHAGLGELCWLATAKSLGV